MGKHIVVYTYNGILLIHEKEGNSDKCCIIQKNLENIMLSAINQTNKDKCCTIPFTLGPQSGQIHRHQIEQRLPGAGARRECGLIA